jgi:hypothetical protein
MPPINPLFSLLKPNYVCRQMDDDKCADLTKLGTRCTRAAVCQVFCRRHFDIRERGKRIAVWLAGGALLP